MRANTALTELAGLVVPIKTTIVSQCMGLVVPSKPPSFQRVLCALAASAATAVCLRNTCAFSTTLGSTVDTRSCVIWKNFTQFLHEGGLGSWGRLTNDVQQADVETSRKREWVEKHLLGFTRRGWVKAPDRSARRSRDVGCDRLFFSFAVWSRCDGSRL